MRKLPGGVLAMSSDLCRPHSRTLVDEYDVDAATGAARRRPWSFPVDLVSYVHQQEILSVLVPDVEAAEVEAMTAVRGASLVGGLGQLGGHVLGVGGGYPQAIDPFDPRLYTPS